MGGKEEMNVVKALEMTETCTEVEMASRKFEKDVVAKGNDGGWAQLVLGF